MTPPPPSPTLPDTMRCVEISKPGEPEVLKISTRPVPSPGPRDVLLHIQAAGVNHPDLFQRRGMYPPPPGASDIPGLEAAGTVVALGRDVTWPTLGEKVAALLLGGGYAEYACADSTLCLPIADHLSFEEAGALPETLFTVFHNVLERGRLKAKDIFLVHGGASGIGTIAIQMAKSIGATVYATAGSDDKCALCQKIGADIAINWRNTDYAAHIKDLKTGVDVILDMAGGARIQKDLRLMNLDGRRISIAFLEGARVELDLMPVMLKRLTLGGSTLRSQSPEEKARMAQEIHTHVWPWVLDGRIHPILHQTFPLEGAKDAHTLMEQRVHSGKIMLSPFL